jgi:hypothetical protein
LREHLQAAGGDEGQGTALGSVSPFVTRILAAEGQLKALRKTQKAQEMERATRADALRSLANGLGTR